METLCIICGKPIDKMRAYEGDAAVNRKYHGGLCRYLANTGYFRNHRFNIDPVAIEVMKSVLATYKP